jgi:hypothetical protein
MPAWEVSEAKRQFPSHLSLTLLFQFEARGVYAQARGRTSNPNTGGIKMAQRVGAGVCAAVLRCGLNLRSLTESGCNTRSLRSIWSIRSICAIRLQLDRAASGAKFPG